MPSIQKIRCHPQWQSETINAFCDHVDKRNCGLWYKTEPTSSRFFFANSQQTWCTEKLVIHMYDKAWSVHTTEFDIMEEGKVPLLMSLMSLPQMRNLGFHFELSPQQSFLNCTRLGMWKHKLRMHSFSYGLPRHCLAHECSLFQDT